MDQVKVAGGNRWVFFCGIFAGHGMSVMVVVMSFDSLHIYSILLGLV